MSEEKARDILAELEARIPVGADLTDKVGRRGWERPRVSVSPKLFVQYRVGDPWDPTAKDSQPSIGLGPVNLRLGEKRRQPAPHLKPKAPAKPKSAGPPQDPRPRVPDAPKPQPKPKSTAAPALSPEARETARLAAEAAEKRRQAEAARGTSRRRTAPQMTDAPASRAPSGPALAPLPVRPEAREAAQAEAQTVAASAQGPDRGGRFRMKPAARSAAPVVREIPAAPAEPEGKEAEPAAPPRPRAAPAGPVKGGLDDLFAAAAQAGRMRVPTSVEPSAEE